jgi:glycosyltransferase involved in cell wall biosynthesis
MVVAFLNLFGSPYEGGANWLEASLLALGLVDDPPLCLVVGATAEQLPPAVSAADHVRAAPAVVAPRSRARVARDVVNRRLHPERWEELGLRSVAEQHDVDVWVAFDAFDGLGPDRPLAVCFPDFQFRHLPGMFDAAQRQERERRWGAAAARADVLLALSQDAADDAVRFDPTVADRIAVCGHAPRFTPELLRLDPDAVRAAYHLPERYLLVSNQLYRHKGHDTVVAALAAIRAGGDEPPTVAIAGRPHDPRSPHWLSELLQSVARQGLHEQCRFLGVVSRDEQLALIRAAEAVVQPSRFEGRGAIAEEAALLGTPLLLSDLAVHRELPVQARRFPVGDAESLAALMRATQPHPRRSVQDIVTASERASRAYGDALLAALQRAVVISAAS